MVDFLTATQRPLSPREREKKRETKGGKSRSAGMSLISKITVGRGSLTDRKGGVGERREVREGGTYDGKKSEEVYYLVRE